MALRAGRLLVAVNQRQEYVSAGAGREERWHSSSPFPYILGVKVIQSKWLKRDRSFFIPHGKKGNCLGNQQFNNIVADVNHFLLLLLISECLLSARTMKDICKEKENRKHQDTEKRGENTALLGFKFSSDVQMMPFNSFSLKWNLAVSWKSKSILSLHFSALNILRKKRKKEKEKQKRKPTKDEPE